MVTISQGQLTARVDSHGAELTSLTLAGREYIWQGDPRWWSRRAPVLFPIVGSLRGGRATSPRGEVRLGRHGLARDREFTVEHADDQSVSLLLKADEATREAFPYNFELRLAYAIQDDRLVQEFEVRSVDDVPMPFTLGGHPAFNLPVPGASDAFGDYRLEFTRPWTCSSPMMADGLWDTSRQLPLIDASDTLELSHELFDVDTLLLVGVPDRRVRLVGPCGHGVGVEFDDFPYLGVWSASGNAPFVAIEPWLGCSTCSDESDDFAAKRGTVTLAPGASRRFAFSIRPF